MIEMAISVSEKDANEADGLRGSRRVLRRRSAGGQALHHWDKEGKLTTIHVLYTMDACVPLADLIDAVQLKLLNRFPRMRGHVSGNGRHWVIPNTADAKDYVKALTLSAPASGSSAASVVQSHIATELRKPLPQTRIWQLQSIRVDSSPTNHYLLWRFSHTVADGVILTHIMSHVLCDTLPSDADGNGAAREAMPSLQSRSSVMATATVFERVLGVFSGLARLGTLLCWRPDSETPLRLGPAKWRRRGGGAELNIGVSAPVAVADLKQAAKRKGVTVNDLLLAATGAGVQKYLMPRSEPRITAVVVVNPRSEAPQLNVPSKALAQYAAMEGQVCARISIMLCNAGIPCIG